MLSKIFFLSSQIKLILTNDELKHLHKFRIIVFFNALLELIGVSVIVPFIFCVLNVEKIFNYEIVQTLSNFLNINSEIHFLVILGIASIIITFFISAISFYVNYKTVEFSQLLSVNFRSRLFNLYLRKNYFYHLSKNSNELINNFIGETLRVTEGIIFPLINIHLKFAVMTIIFLSLVYIKPIPTILIFILIIFFYWQVYRRITKKITNLGYRTKIYNDQIGRYGYPSINDIKNTKIYSMEDTYFKKIKYFFNKDSKIKIITNSISILPKQMIDFFLIFFAIMVILIYLISHGSINNVLPIMGAFIYAAGKIIPQANNLYTSLASIKNNLPALDNIIDDLKESLKIVAPETKKLNLKDNISLNNITFGYPGNKKNLKRVDVIQNITFEVKRGDKIGLYGTSGNGKSTLADIISGLIKPQAGFLSLDSVPIISEEEYFNYRKLICYISQAPFLIKSSLEKNIAFQSEVIDHKKLMEASKLSQCYDFIEELPKKYKTEISDRINFSGGQSQRISLARAFYLNKEVTIFDECTSNVDMNSEKKIIDNIFDFFEPKALIIISHRINNLKNCNKIFEFSNSGILKKIK